MVRGSVLLFSALLCAQQTPSPEGASAVTVVPPADPSANPADDIEYICPMDKDQRSKVPAQCPICHMQMVKNLPEPIEFPVKITATPMPLKPGRNTQLTFRVNDPTTKKPVTYFEIVHEKLYHLFVISQDMTFFKHTHPEKQADSSFKLDANFPKAGEYRILSDFYPSGATPQLVANTMMIPGPGFKLEPAHLDPDVAPKHSTGEVHGQPVDGNLDADLQLEPAQPIVGEKTMMFFHVRPNKDIELYLGAWAHMLSASSDLIDMIHSHPFLVTDPLDADYKQIQFNAIFPRAGIYRVWIQIQRAGVVNTIAFNIPVSELK